MEARVGLDEAWGLESGPAAPEEDTLYAAGTDNLRDVWDDLKIPAGLAHYADRHQQADKVLDASPHIRKVAGHSLGGAVAIELAKNTRIRSWRPRRTALQSFRLRARSTDIIIGPTRQPLWTLKLKRLSRGTLARTRS